MEGYTSTARSDSAAKIVETESGGEDAFTRAAKNEPPPVRSRFVSSGTVGVGEGVQFELTAAEVVNDTFNDGTKIIQIRGQVIDCRAEGLVEEGEIAIDCRSARLEQFGNAVMGLAGPGDVITLFRGEDEGKKTGWRWMIDHPADGELALGPASVGEEAEEPLPTEPPEEG